MSGAAGSLAGRVAVVTGATRGIGRATARSLGQRGARLVLVGRSTTEHPNRVLPGTLEEAGDEFQSEGLEATTVAADLGSADDTERILEATLGSFGRCDVLVNNAAFMPSGPILKMPWRRWQSVLRINAVAALQLIQGFVPGMLERQWGRVLNVSSGASTGAPADLFMYGSSKTLLDRLTTDLHAEAGGHGVAFNAVRVSAVATEQWHYANDSGILDRQGTGPDAAVFNPAAVGEAFAWLIEQPGECSGHLFSFNELIERGALQPPSVVS
jgi:NAD(P)-dependent dehydrogenase (short-subunit alcohol dehydrogenase family)